MKEFKVGDWVRHIESNNIYKINGFSIHGQTKGFIQIHDEYHLVPQSECELWQPKEGEDIWEKDYGLSLVISNDENGINCIVCFCLTSVFGKEFTTTLKDCEPFIGELPSFLKDER